MWNPDYHRYKNNNIHSIWIYWQKLTFTGKQLFLTGNWGTSLHFAPLRTTLSANAVFSDSRWTPQQPTHISKLFGLLTLLISPKQIAWNNMKLSLAELYSWPSDKLTAIWESPRGGWYLLDYFPLHQTNCCRKLILIHSQINFGNIPLILYSRKGMNLSQTKLKWNKYSSSSPTSASLH